MQPYLLSARQDTDNQNGFFGFEKYGYTYRYFSHLNQADLSASGSAQRRIAGLAKKFVGGFDALGDGEIDKAILQFKSASRLLPEYFHTDFIIALCYEKKGDFKKAARFYKSYLMKLRKFDGGLFRLTQPFIAKTVIFDIPDYETAKALIAQRMAMYGIDIEKVPAGEHPLLLISIIIFIIIGGIVYLLSKTTPVKKILYKTKAGFNRNKDIWVCRHCGKENSNINTKCYNCGTPPMG